MEIATNFFQWINDTDMAEAFRESVWLFPAIETVHVIAIVLVVGAIARLDLRLLGLVWKDRPVTDVQDEMLPWSWWAFAIATVFGILLWTTKPIMYFRMPFFDVKMILILLAGINMLVFHHLTSNSVTLWNHDRVPPLAVRAAGGLSLAFWVSVVICGRFIGFI